MSRPSQVLPLLFAGEFAERFSFWGLQSLLVLYLTKSLELPNNKAYLVYGTFTAFTFALSILGGLVADLFLSFRKALTLGAILAMLGNIFLVFSALRATYLGLALLITGTALFAPNVANFLGGFYQESDAKRDKAFTLFYMAPNLGGLFGPVVYGILAMRYGWHSSFFVSAILMASWLCVFLAMQRSILSQETTPRFIQEKIRWHRIISYGVYPAIFCSILIIWFLIQHRHFAGELLMTVGIMTLLFLSRIAWKKQPTERYAIITLIIMMFFCLVFFASELQVNNSLLVFAEQHVNRQLFNFQIPTSAFASLEPLFVIILAPAFAYLWAILKQREPAPTLKIALGLLLESLGFFVIAIAASQITNSEQKIALSWMLVGNLLLGAGEICLMPTVISAITKLAPAGMKGTLMGALYLSLAFSSYLTGLIATFTLQPSAANLDAAGEYAVVYAAIAKFSLLAAGLGLLFYTVSRCIAKKLSSTPCISKTS